MTSRLHRLALAVVAASSLVVGFWASLLPRSFYDDFPSFGQVWVGVDGPYNEHLVRDVGGLNLGLALVAVVALVSGNVLVGRAAGGAALVYGLPHLLYHATHLAPFDTSTAVPMIGGLVVAAAAAAVALLPVRPVPDPGRERTRATHR